MQNKFIAIVLVFVFASFSYATPHSKLYGPFHDVSGAFHNFTMGFSMGLGASILLGDDIYKSDTSSMNYNLSFNMAFPLTDDMDVVASVGTSYWNFRCKYEYLHRNVVNSVQVYSFEIGALYEVFYKRFFMGVGPNVRVPFLAPLVREKVVIDGKVVYSDSPSYARSLWLNIDAALGAKFGAVEFGLRGGYELLGFYKETKEYIKINMHELRCFFYITYWFGYWINGRKDKTNN